MALKIIQILMALVTLGSVGTYAQSPSTEHQLFSQLEQTSGPFVMDGVVKQLEYQWFRQPFDLPTVQIGYEKLLKILKPKNLSLFLKVQQQSEAIEDLMTPKDPHAQNELYEIFRGNLIVMSDKIEKRSPIESQQKFRTYVLSYVLEGTSASTESDWLVWKGLSRVIGHEADEIKSVETWIQKNAPHPIALRIFPLFEFHFKEIHGWEGPKQELRPEDAQRLDGLKQQVFASAT